MCMYLYLYIFYGIIALWDSARMTVSMSPVFLAYLQGQGLSPVSLRISKIVIKYFKPLVSDIQAKLSALLYFLQSDISVSMGLQAKAEIKVQLLLIWRMVQAQHGTSSPSSSCDTRSDEEMCLRLLLIGTSLKLLINSHLSRIGLAL